MDTTDYTEVLQELVAKIEQMNSNIVNAVCVIAALVGLVIGFLAAKELLKIWL